MTKSRAFTLVETIFSTLFISLTVLAIVNLFPGAYLSVRKSETQLQSDIIANSITEELRAVHDWDSANHDMSLEGTAERLSQEQTIDGLTYRAEVSVYPVDTANDDDVVRGVKVEIVVELRRNFVKEEQRTETYETYLHSL